MDIISHALLIAGKVKKHIFCIFSNCKGQNDGY